MRKQKRNSARHRVNLWVRFAVASDFVVEYAENLSQGGLFVPGAHHLEPLANTTVEVELPGAGTFKLTCEVAHVLTPDIAAAMKRKPGAGMAIKRAPKGFMDVLKSYLQRLGRRADAVVMAADRACGAVLEQAGYQVLPAPVPEELAIAMVRCDDPIVAVVVPRRLEHAYQQAAAAGGAGDVVIGMDDPAELGDALERIDAEL